LYFIILEDSNQAFSLFSLPRGEDNREGVFNQLPHQFSSLKWGQDLKDYILRLRLIITFTIETKVPTKSYLHEDSPVFFYPL
jgi:hypothetical protein